MATCELHKFHSPKPNTDETHHIIPQAWQVFWNPTTGHNLKVVWRAQEPRPIQATKDQLWDPRTAELCPTGHRNVHYWLVLYMKDFAMPLSNLRGGLRTAARSNEQKMAKLAMDRYEAAGGSLQMLCDAKLWGNA
jgi:hypothetical protein